MILVFRSGEVVTGVRSPLSPIYGTAASAADEILAVQVYLKVRG